MSVLAAAFCALFCGTDEIWRGRYGNLYLSYYVIFWLYLKLKKAIIPTFSDVLRLLHSQMLALSRCARNVLQRQLVAAHAPLRCFTTGSALLFDRQCGGSVFWSPSEWMVITETNLILEYFFSLRGGSGWVSGVSDPCRYFFYGSRDRFFSNTDTDPDPG